MKDKASLEAVISELEEGMGTGVAGVGNRFSPFRLDPGAVGSGRRYQGLDDRTEHAARFNDVWQRQSAGTRQYERRDYNVTEHSEICT